MLNSLKDKIALSFLDSVLNSYEANELDSGKRLVSTIAGIYLLQKAIREVRKHPYKAAQKFALSGLLFYTAASGLNKKIIRKHRDHSDVRKNQIQGNDPHSIPAFV